MGISDNKGRYNELVYTKYQNIALAYWFNTGFTITRVDEPVFVLTQIRV